MAWATKSHDFSAGTTAKAQEVDDNFDDMVDQLDTAMPSGGIIMWSGSTASIPTGWYLCDGTNSTPNLQDRFVVGAGSTYAVGATGGVATNNLAHSHIVDTHTHTMNHTHTFAGTTQAENIQDLCSSGSINVADNNHQHNFSGTTDQSGTTATGGATPGTNSTLSSSTENRPPYYALAYIMKS